MLARNRANHGAIDTQLGKRGTLSPATQIAIALIFAGISYSCFLPLAAAQPEAPGTTLKDSRDTATPGGECEPSDAGSPYIPLDSWIYPAMARLYGMGYANYPFLDMRPWTRTSVRHMLEETSAQISDADMYGDPTTGAAESLYEALNRELQLTALGPCLAHKVNIHIETAYSVVRAIGGTPLRDSYHLGSTIINDYGRPFENGFNSYSGASGNASAGRFGLYIRGELRDVPSAAGYSTGLAQALAAIDGTTYGYNQTTIPQGPIDGIREGRFIEAYASAQYLNHVFSIGKQDDWLGPGLGGAMAYSNNAENIYSFHINRVEPLQVPLLSRITGPFRYEFLVGALRGHTYMPPDSANNSVIVNPGDPWVHVEKISFRPTEDLQFGFERTVIWGGQGHDPINFHSFLRSFFSFTAPDAAVKASHSDPGARFGAFDFSYRMPFARNWLTLYGDSEVHDDVSPIDAPQRAAWRPGIYLSHVPGLPKLDIRAEAATTDPSSDSGESKSGHFMYWETIQRQGYTNQGQLFGDWIGRADKGGQGWFTYHLSGNEWIQVGWRNQKAASYFIPGGTTQNNIDFQIVKRLRKDFEINASFSFEDWKAPIYLTGEQTVTVTRVQLTWFPERKVSF
jgi:Capsule assembly protein Wzi